MRTTEVPLPRLRAAADAQARSTMPPKRPCWEVQCVMPAQLYADPPAFLSALVYAQHDSAREAARRGLQLHLQPDAAQLIGTWGPCPHCTLAPHAIPLPLGEGATQVLLAVRWRIVGWCN